MAIILACDSSTHACSCALLDGGMLFERFVVAPRQHAALLLDQVDSVLDEAHYQLSDVTAFALGVGPGSFMGLRISASVIQAFAYGQDKPVMRVSSLAALAQTSYDQYGYERVSAAWDARMQEIYWGEYQCQSGLMQALTTDCLIKPEALVCRQDWMPVGNAWLEYLSIDPGVEVYPHASAVAKLGLKAYEEGRVVTPAEAIPNYVRMKVANVKKKG